MAGQLGGADGATRVALLTGSMSAAQKKQVRGEITSGQVGIVVGTHALLQEAVGAGGTQGALMALLDMGSEPGPTTLN